MKVKKSKYFFCLLAYFTCIKSIYGLKCFQCSENDGVPCPNTTIAIEDWATSSNYLSVGPQTDNSCVVGFSNDTNKVYYQSGTSTKICTSTDFQQIIIVKVNTKSTGGAMYCCGVDGCNWNSDSAMNNKDYATLTGKWYIFPDIVNWTQIIIAIMVVPLIVICCCGLCCFFCFKSRSRNRRRAQPKIILPPPQPFNRVRMVVTPIPVPIGVKSHSSSPEHYSNKKKSVQSPDHHSQKKPIPPPPPKKNSTDSENKYSIPLDKDQKDWEEIWKNANNPNYNGPLSQNKKYLK